MAIMIPTEPRNCSERSREKEIFYALKNNLSNDYYVIHSMRFININDDVFDESECDFVIYNQNYGIICIEAKAGGAPQYHDGRWFYSNGVQMSGDGPFAQAMNEKYDLINYIKKTKCSYILKNCKIFHAVWFVELYENQLHSINLPSDVNEKIILTAEALNNPEIYFKTIFDMKIILNTVKGPIEVNTNLTEQDNEKMINTIICPKFKVFSSTTKISEAYFNNLLKQQSLVLDFLDEQKVVAINGVAGTGKTVLAIEKARQFAADGDKVLFLCYNKLLCKYLSKNYKNDNIIYYTIDEFACNYVIPHQINANYTLLKNALESEFFTGGNPISFKHVIIDEGQDLGRRTINDNKILSLLSAITNKKNGQFFIFYDKLQMILSDDIPDIIKEADCKISLNRNCRNTLNIAKTSLKPITITTPILKQGYKTGVPASFYIRETKHDLIEALNDAIINLKTNVETKNITILTVKTLDKSLISDLLVDTKISGNRIVEGQYEFNGIKYKFFSCQTFKGLEDDGIILIDVDYNTFINDISRENIDNEEKVNFNNKKIYYVGTSRARNYLSIIACLNESEIEKLLKEYCVDSTDDLKTDFTDFMNCELK